MKAKSILSISLLVLTLISYFQCIARQTGMRKVVVSLILILSSFHSWTQNQAIDSLTALFNDATEISDQINLKCQISQRFTEIGEFEQGGKLANEALMMAESANDEGGIGLAYYSLARLNQYIGDWYKALTYHYRAFPIFESLELKEELAWTYLNMGISFHAQKSLKRAVRYDTKALEIFKELKHNQGIAYSYLNLGLALSDRGDFDQAINYMNNARDICEEIGDQRGVGYVLNSMAEIHENTGEYEQAIQGNLACIKIREKENDKMDLSFCYSNLGSIYLKQGLPKKSEQQLKTSERLAKEVNAQAVLRSVYLTWSKVDSVNGNYRSAYEHFKLYSYYHDLLSSEESQRKAAELQYSFEKERKEKEIELMKKEQDLKDIVNSKDQRNLMISLGTLGFTLLIVIAFFVSVYKRANRIRKQKNIITQQKERVDEQHKSITDSIVYAQKIQQALLTSEAYILQHLQQDFFIHYQPKDIVSGDFYWAHEHNDSFYLTTADCTGHGVPGAFMSLLNISIMSELIIGKNITSPAEVLNLQRKHIIQALNAQGTDHAQDGMDCILCKFNPKSNQLTFSAANHSLWLLRDHKIIKYKGNKMPIGKYLNEDKNFTEQTIELQKGDLIYTFTDGITDQFGGEDDKKFKPRRLSELLLSVHELPLEEQKMIIIRTIEEWIGNNEQTDDILIVGVKYEGITT